MRGQQINLVEVNQHAIGNVQHPQVARNVHVAVHAVPSDSHPAPIALGNIGNLLNARDERSEGRHDDAPFRLCGTRGQTPR
jgi:hypothetical protein